MMVAPVGARIESQIGEQVQSSVSSSKASALEGYLSGWWGALLGESPLPSTTGAIGPQAHHADEWLAADKLQHFVACAVLTLVALWGLSFWRGPPSTTSDRLLQATCISFAFGALKEVGDFGKWWPGEVSAKDLVADAAGCAFAVLLVLLWHKCACATAWDTLLKGFSGQSGAKHSRLVDLELGLVYGQQLRRAIINSASDLPWLQRLTTPTKSGKAGKP